MTPYLTADDPGDERESNPPRPQAQTCLMCRGAGVLYRPYVTGLMDGDIYTGSYCPTCGGSGSVTR